MDVRKRAWKSLFESILEGRKKFDLRLYDEEFKDLKEGDFLVVSLENE